MKGVLISIILGMQLSGCTFIGFVIGGNTPKKSKTLEDWQPENIERGQKVSISFTDSTSLVGLFQGNQFEPFDSYSTRYQSWYQQSGNIRDVPLPGDLIRVSLKDTIRTGTFNGFDKGILYLGSERGGYSAILMDDIADLRIDQRVVFNMERLNGLLANEELPLRTRVVLSDRKGKEVWHLNPEEVEQVQVYGKHHAVAGIVTGAIIDIVAFAYAWSKMNIFANCSPNCFNLPK